jgi:serine protease Do
VPRRPPAPKPEAEPSGEILGLTVAPLTDEMREQLGAQGVSGGLVIEAVDAASDAASKGLQVGDIITEVAQQPVRSVADFPSASMRRRRRARRASCS